MTKPKGNGRTERDIECVRRLAELLRSVSSKPEAYANDTDLISALNSQGALSKYAGSSLTRMSLNHQKRVADTALGGYAQLDALRLAAKHAVQRSLTKPGQRVASKRTLSEQVQALLRERLLLLQDLFLLQRAYDIRCDQARAYAAVAGTSVSALCAKEQRELDASLALRQIPSGNGQGVSLI